MDENRTGLDGLLATSAAAEKVADGCTWSEGPLWLPATRELRWSDIPGNRIMTFDPATGVTATHRDRVDYTNGRALMPDGGVVQCSHGRRAVEVETDGAVRVLVDTFGGRRLNSPNDVVVHSDGSIWFTDPPYGITVAEEGHAGEREYADHFVFRFDPVSDQLAAVVTDVEEPNGLAFSPDETVLYVSDTSAARSEDGSGNHHIRAYDVNPAAPWTAAKNGRTVAVVSPGVPDGFKVDELGNLWSSSGSGVQIFDGAGAHLGSVAVPEVVGNLCFGGPDGRDLFIAASTGIYRLRTTVRDAGARRAAPVGLSTERTSWQDGPIKPE